MKILVIDEINFGKVWKKYENIILLYGESVDFSWCVWSVGKKYNFYKNK